MFANLNQSFFYFYSNILLFKEELGVDFMTTTICYGGNDEMLKIYDGLRVLGLQKGRMYPRIHAR